MTKNYSIAADRPDSLAGVVAAFEGISDAYTMLNSPIGCKFPLGYTSNIMSSHVNPVQFKTLTDFHFGQSRLPCTFTDEQDFVFGTQEKITRALQILDSRGYGLIGVINHSGTALIGDDLCRIIQSSGVKTKTMVVDSSGFTGTYADGFKIGAIKILERLATNRKEVLPHSVNIIGPTIFQYNWQNDVSELKHTLKALGISVISVIGAGEKIRNLERVNEAALNLVVYEEYGDSIANFLEKEYGTPSIGLDVPAPYGLEASETWFGLAANFFNLPVKPIQIKSKHTRIKCYRGLSRMSRFNSALRGARFAVFGDSSQVVPLIAFLYGYLGMYPVIVGLKEVGPKSYGLLRKYLTANSLETAVLINPDQYEIIEALNEHVPVLLFGSGIEEQLATMSEEPAEFLPVSFPYYEKALLTMRPLLGFNGVLGLVEDVINSIRRNYLSHGKLS
ncbi:MAG: nitrogenase component 1 [Candidatus Bathyarchaeia archaeon]|jgi:light-independent protochlorophyllide reductase B subunit